MIQKYFHNISQEQIDKFNKLPDFYSFWNEKINVISRKDIENIFERHILHSLAIAKIIEFQANTKILDIGTGGGFPGIPLAIMFPQCQFHLVDSIEKKMKVVDDIVEKLELNNVKTSVERVENLRENYDFVVNRAVKPLPTIINWVKKNIGKKSFNTLPNGIICLKGGDLQEELSEIKAQCKIWNISDFFDESFFETKKVVFWVKSCLEP
jgi:16S rRNA (guanine527-N7)-methyltransferase